MARVLGNHGERRNSQTDESAQPHLALYGLFLTESELDRDHKPIRDSSTTGRTVPPSAGASGGQ